MNTEQLSAEFEAWYGPDSTTDVTLGRGEWSEGKCAAWDAWQAALQWQGREDAGRIQFMADEACTFNTWKQEDGSWKYRLEWDHGTEWQTEWFSTPEEAIDHARRVEGMEISVNKFNET